jgi:prolipoprotein diacylglyceryltransferase
VDETFALAGNFSIGIFSLTLAIGVLLGLFRLAHHTPGHQLHQRFNTAIWVLISAFAGGRIGYVLVQWPYYQNHPLEIPQVWLGGMYWPGALAGGILTLAIVAIVTQGNLGKLADALLPLLSLTTATVWLGCWLSGVAYGPEIDAWWALPARDIWGDVADRLPVQILAALLNLLLFWGIDRLWVRGWRQIPGLAASLGLAGSSLIQLGASLLRVDPAPRWNGISLDIWLSSGFVILSIITTFISLLLSKRKHPVT